MEEGNRVASKVIDFTSWVVLVLVGIEKDGVIDTLVNSEDACSMMDRCHRKSNKQTFLILSPYYAVVAGRGANCRSHPEIISRSLCLHSILFPFFHIMHVLSL